MKNNLEIKKKWHFMLKVHKKKHNRSDCKVPMTVYYCILYCTILTFLTNYTNKGDRLKNIVAKFTPDTLINIFFRLLPLNFYQFLRRDYSVDLIFIQELIIS